MSLIPRFVAYAAAFEQAYASDDWAALEPFFDERAVYEIGVAALGRARCDGRAEVLAWFPDVLDRFDRRFDSRELVLLDGPKEQGDTVWIKGTAVYRAAGLPDLELTLEETVRFEGDRIVHLEDRYTPAMIEELEAYVHEHGPTLGLDLELG